MKVLDLQCGQLHTFEGWFGSEDDFQSQLARHLVACPMCGDTAVTKMLSAPRLNFGAALAREPKVADTSQASPTSATAVSTKPIVPDVQKAWMKMVRHVLDNTENVGIQFAEEARKMHYGESDVRNIRGHATPAETEALLDEGIDVLPLLIPAGLDGPLQ